MVRIIISTIFLLTLHLAIFAEYISYSYDNAGNRVKREIVLQKTINPDTEKNIFFSESLSEKEITISPNPTQGNLSIEIRGFEKSDECKFQILDLSGKIILSDKAVSPISKVDISHHPKGIYILNIVINGINSSWKIIKNNK